MRRRLLLGAGLFVLALLTRWPLRATVLEEYDSANYALAVLDFDMFAERPHPPGYIFYVWAARAAHAVVGDPILALSSTSALSGAVAVVLLLELLAPVLGLGAAGAACLAVLAAAQVWLQHVRPMQDAFAAAWMLAGALALVRATEGGGLGRWCGAMGFVGLSAGAKQVLPIFLAGLLLHAATAAWRRGGVRWLAAGASAAVVSSLAWFLPLSIHCGGPGTYVEWALGQVVWQREHDAAAFGLSMERVLSQARATFVIPAGPPWLAWPMWALAALGGVSAARRVGARWLLWLLLPLVAMRVLLLGAWPRFSLYYLPFVIALAALGLGLALASLSRRARVTCAGAALAAWCVLQARHVGPTLRALHEGPSPVASALDVLAARRPPAETVLIVDRRVLGRHVAYYNGRHGFRHVLEDEMPAGVLRDARHVVKLHAGAPRVTGDWSGQGEPVGDWRLDVPRAEALSPVQEFWRVSAFELRGAYVAWRRFRQDEGGRRLATPDSAVVIFHAPAEGAVVRLYLAAPAAARFVVGEQREIPWRGRGTIAELRLSAAETAGGRVRLDVIPECGEPDCLALTRVEVAAP